MISGLRRRSPGKAHARPAIYGRRSSPVALFPLGVRIILWAAFPTYGFHSDLASLSLAPAWVAFFCSDPTLPKYRIPLKNGVSRAARSRSVTFWEWTLLITRRPGVPAPNPKRTPQCHGEDRRPLNRWSPHVPCPVRTSPEGPISLSGPIKSPFGKL